MNPEMFKLPVDLQDLQERDVVFDMDGTLIEGDLGETVFYWYLLKYSNINLAPIRNNKGFIPDVFKSKVQFHGTSARALNRYQKLLKSRQYPRAYAYSAQWIEQYAEDNPYDITQWILAPHTHPFQFKGKAVLNHKDREFILKFGARIKPEVKDLAASFCTVGARIWIVSASPQQVCEAAAAMLDIKPSQVIGAKKSNGDMSVPWGEQKVRELRTSGVLRPALAFGDSGGDRELLNFADHGVIMKDSGPELRREARQNGWSVFPEEKSLP